LKSGIVTPPSNTESRKPDFVSYAYGEKFFKCFSSGARSLAFAPTMEMPKFEHEDYKLKYYKPKLASREPRTPAQILKEAWDEVGLHMWNAMDEIEKEYGERLAK